MPILRRIFGLFSRSPKTEAPFAVPFETESTATVPGRVPARLVEGLTPFGAAVRSMRWRRGESGEAFAARFTARQTAVSRWEGGVSIPEVPALLALLGLAETDDERQPILDALKERLGCPGDLHSPEVERAARQAAKAFTSLQRAVERLKGDSDASL